MEFFRPRMDQQKSAEELRSALLARLGTNEDELRSVNAQEILPGKLDEFHEEDHKLDRLLGAAVAEAGMLGPDSIETMDVEAMRLQLNLWRKLKGVKGDHRGH